MRMTKILAMAAFVGLAASAAWAQKTTEEGIAEYRAMLQDGNPAELFEAKGEDLWKKPRGPKNASLEKCDLGKGAGVVKGAFVELPRYFPDTKRVQDLESRLLTCMEALQGFNAAEIANTPFGKGEQANLEGLVAWISSESRGMKLNVPQSRPEEKTMYEVGKRLFFARAGTHDFACASCHGTDNKRIRLQDLPNLTKPSGAASGFGSWPAYRVSSGELWGMQRRLNDCYRQQRFPYPRFGSDATIALAVYMGVTGKGGVSVAPAIKR
ncbi:sulfur oxidation c-type cytochrome SoxA [Polaromonas sp. C04]|uniref:sulfur oxidation c-type cytochrome SoxA n=1 Tax=Polaromonas sp. C04 TaxID=1945857 RepID=UPI000985C0A5|nr:sulfur oxidation c-type cytochrome SoxA [Polaromonas sp. C04]OOG59238.1 sulfur oxidation c-type cytochrome SoxA [Polaromonas sp. C04]